MHIIPMCRIALLAINVSVRVEVMYIIKRIRNSDLKRNLSEREYLLCEKS